MAVASPESMMPKPLAASSSATAQSGAGKGFDVVDAYHRALNDDKVSLRPRTSPSSPTFRRAVSCDPSYPRRRSYPTPLY